MDRFFVGKVALVTGASSGIGRAIAKDLVQAGAKVALVARNEERLKQTASALGLEETLVCPLDVVNPQDVERTVEKVMTAFGRIDILVNCAGVFSADGIGSLSIEAIDQMMSINFMGTVNCIKTVIPHMSAQGSGHIVVLSSLGGRVPFPGCAGYSASKFALYGFANTIRPELKKAGIHLTALYPSFVDSPLVEGHIDSVKESFFFRLTRGFSPDKVSRAALRGIKKRKREMVLPRILSSTAAIYGLFPNLVELLIGLLHGGWPNPFPESGTSKRPR